MSRGRKEVNKVITLFILGTIVFLLWLGFHLTGAILAALVWLCIKLPLAILLGCLGLVCCVTLILIPIGVKCFRFGWETLT